MDSIDQLMPGSLLTVEPLGTPEGSMALPSKQLKLATFPIDDEWSIRECQGTVETAIDTDAMNTLQYAPSMNLDNPWLEVPVSGAVIVKQRVGEITSS